MKKKKVSVKKISAIWAMGSASDPRWNRQGVYKVKPVGTKKKVTLPPPGQMPAEAEAALFELERSLGPKHPKDFQFKVFPAHPHPHPHLPLEKHDLGLSGFPPTGAETARQEKTLLRLFRAVKMLDRVIEVMGHDNPVSDAAGEVGDAILDLCGLPEQQRDDAYMQYRALVRVADNEDDFRGILSALSFEAAEAAQN